LARSSHPDYSSFLFRGGSDFREHRPARAARLRAAALPRRRLHLDARLLGLPPRRLLLGSRHMGDTTDRGCALDTRLLGMGQWRVHMARRLLGTAHWLLWWRELRVRLLWRRL